MVHVMGRSSNTLLNDLKNNKMNPFTLTTHAIEKGRTFDFKDVEIGDKENDYQKRLVLKMLHIKRDNDIQHLSHIKNNLIYNRQL